MHILRDIIHHEIIEKRYKLFDFHSKFLMRKSGPENSLASGLGLNRKNSGNSNNNTSKTLYNHLENDFETCLPLGSHHLILAQLLCMQFSRALKRRYTVTHTVVGINIILFLSLFFLSIKRWWWNFGFCEYGTRITAHTHIHTPQWNEGKATQKIEKMNKRRRRKNKACFSTFISHILVKRFHCSFSLPQSTVDGYVVRILTSMYFAWHFCYFYSFRHTNGATAAAHSLSLTPSSYLYSIYS